MTVEQTRAWVPSNTFGTRLLLIRRELGLTVKEAAHKSGLHYATWSTWENGRTPANMAEAVRQIHDTLGVDREWLMWGKKETPRPNGPEGIQLPRLDSNQQPFGCWSSQVRAAPMAA